MTTGGTGGEASEPQQRLAARLLPDAAATLALRVIGLFAQVAAFVVIARTHTLADVGLYAVCNSVLQIARMLGPCGLDYGAYRFCSTYFDEGRPDKAAAFAGFASRRVVAMVGSVAALGLAAAGLLHAAGLIGQKAMVLSTLTAFGLLPFSFLGLFGSLHRSSGSMVWAQSPDGIGLPLLLAAAVGTAAASGHANAITTVAALVAVAAIMTAASVIRWRAVVGPERAPLGRETEREVVTMTNRVMAGVSVANLATRSQVLLVSAVLGPAAAGLYEAASRFGSLATMTSFAANAAVAPLLARARSRNDHGDQQDLYTIASAAQALPATAILLAILFLGSWLLTTFVGEDFAPAYGPMVLIALAELIGSFAGPASAYLMLCGRERVPLWYSFIGLVIGLIGIPVLGWTFGLLGAAAVPAVCELVRTVGMSRVIWLEERIRPGILAPSEIARCLAWARRLVSGDFAAALRFER